MKCKKRVYVELSQELKKMYGEEAALESASKEQLYSAIWNLSKKKAIALCRYKDTELVNSINITAFESLPGCLLVNNLLKLDLLLDVNVILCRLGYSIDDIEKMGTFSSLRDGDFATALLASMMLHFLHRSSEPPLPKWTMPEELRKKAGVLNPKDMYGRADHRHEANHEATMWGRKFRRDEYHGHKIPDKPYQSTRPFRHHSQKQFGV